MSNLNMSVATKAGEGLPMESLTPEQLRSLLLVRSFIREPPVLMWRNGTDSKQLAWGPELVYTVAIATIKFSILVSYYLIFGRLR